MIYQELQLIVWLLEKLPSTRSLSLSHLIAKDWVSSKKAMLFLVVRSCFNLWRLTPPPHTHTHTHTRKKETNKETNNNKNMEIALLCCAASFVGGLRLLPFIPKMTLRKGFQTATSSTVIMFFATTFNRVLFKVSLVSFDVLVSKWLNSDQHIKRSYVGSTGSTMSYHATMTDGKALYDLVEFHGQWCLPSSSVVMSHTATRLSHKELHLWWRWCMVPQLPHASSARTLYEDKSIGQPGFCRTLWKQNESNACCKGPTG